MNKTHRVEGHCAEQIIAINETTWNRIFRCEGSEFCPGDMVLLWMFYAKTAQRQGTFRVWSTTEFTAKGLGWSIRRVRKAKRGLESLGLVEDVRSTDAQGHVDKWYVQVFHLVSEAKKQVHPCSFRQGGEQRPKCLDTTSTGNASADSPSERKSKETKGTGFRKPDSVVKERKPEKKPKLSIKDSPRGTAKRHVVPRQNPFIDPYPTEDEFYDFISEQGACAIETFKTWAEFEAAGWLDGQKKPIRHWREFLLGLDDRIMESKTGRVA